MYVSVRDDTLLATGFDTISEGLAFYGLSDIELFVERSNEVKSITSPAGGQKITLDNAGVRTLASQLADAGARVSAFCLGNNFNAPDIDSELAWVIGVVKAAAELGVPAVRIDAIMQGERDLPLEKRREIFASGVNKVLSATEGLPVDLGIENHGFQGNDPAFLDGLMDAVGSNRLGLTMDTGNFYWSGKPLDEVYQILEHFAPKAKHTHIKNIRYPEEMRNTKREMGFEYGRYCCPIPEGDIDHSRLIGFLKAAGYDRDLCLEDESLGKYEIPQRKANIQATVDYFRKLL